MRVQTKWGVEAVINHFVSCPQCGFREVACKEMRWWHETVVCSNCGHEFDQWDATNHRIRWDFPDTMSDQLRFTVNREFSAWAKEFNLPIRITRDNT
jgi:predicted RNA-binding Zn-ribbon protein involved in translation (DUF1610 family)